MQHVKFFSDLAMNHTKWWTTEFTSY